MSRPLSPFIRHLGEAKARARHIRHQAEQLEAALIELAGGAGGSREEVNRWIEALRTQLECAERQAAAFVCEQKVARGGQGSL